MRKIKIKKGLTIFLIINLFQGKLLDLNLTSKVVTFLKTFYNDKLNPITLEVVMDLIINIALNTKINDEIQKIKKNLILDEKELEIKLLKVGCSLE